MSKEFDYIPGGSSDTMSEILSNSRNSIVEKRQKKKTLAKKMKLEAKLNKGSGKQINH